MHLDFWYPKVISSYSILTELLVINSTFCHKSTNHCKCWFLLSWGAGKSIQIILKKPSDVTWPINRTIYPIIQIYKKTHITIYPTKMWKLLQFGVTSQFTYLLASVNIPVNGHSIDWKEKQICFIYSLSIHCHPFWSYYFLIVAPPLEQVWSLDLSTGYKFFISSIDVFYVCGLVITTEYICLYIYVLSYKQETTIRELENLILRTLSRKPLEKFIGTFSVTMFFKELMVALNDIGNIIYICHYCKLWYR